MHGAHLSRSRMSTDMPRKAQPRKPKTSAQRGRPRKPVNPAQIEKLAAIGCTQEEIGLVLGISVDTLSRNFAESFKRGLATLKESLRRRQVKLAKEGSTTMLIWLGKQYLGQSDQTWHQISGDLALLTPEQMEAKRKERWAQVAPVLTQALTGEGESDVA